MLSLPAKDASLELEWASKLWCTVWHTHAGSRTRLGADSLGIIVERLRRSLRAALARMDEPEARLAAPDFVLALSEDHYTLYLEDIVDGAQLWIQDPRATMFAKIPLDAPTITKWLRVLARSELPPTTSED